MTFFHAALLALLAFPDHSVTLSSRAAVAPAARRAGGQLTPAVQAATPPPVCTEWQACRQLALDAAAREDFETFHDLAWRAVQTGPKNDPALMYLLARAQSLSGRPGDALVMLQRLAAMGVPTDAAASDDFRRVRMLSGWTGLSAPAGGTAPTATVNATPGGADRAVTPAAPGIASGRGRRDAGPPVPATATPESRAPDAAVAGEALRFMAPQFTPAGLAYDAVSRRFIVGDRHARKLAVVDEFSKNVANLASGFGEIAALEIDPHLGNLWVVSADAQQTTLHKLQLVSGRSLGSYAVGEGLGPARFVDVAATAQSVVLVLDGQGHRLFQLRPKGTALELAAVLPDSAASSVAPASDAVAYVATAAGVTRVDLASRTSVAVKTAAGVDVTGITRLRWHQGALIAVQQAADGSYRAVRIALDRAGRTVTAVALLEALPATDPTAAAISGDVLFYLTGGEGTEMIVKRVVLR